MSNELDNVSELINNFTTTKLPGGGGVETDSPVVEAAIAASIVGATVYGLYKLFSSDD